MGYSRWTSNYLQRILLFDPTYMMSTTDPLSISVETPRIDSGCSLEKNFTKLICINPSMLLCSNVNHIDSCHDCIGDSLT